MIVVDDIHKHFGGFHAVDGANLTIGKGTITGLIGPNGAGKTTLFNVIAGVLKPTSGRVTMDGADITGQIFGVRGREVFLFSQPRPVATLVSGGDEWSPAELAAAMDGDFREQFTSLETDLEAFDTEPIV